MRKYFALLWFILCLVVCSSALSESISLENCSIELCLPDNWICVSSNNIQKLDAAYGFIAEYVSTMKDSMNAIVVIPSGASYDTEDYLEISVLPMESYHRDYSTMTKEQLSNVGESFLRSGEYSAYELAYTESGTPLLKLQNSEKQTIYTVYATNKLGVRITIKCYGNWSSIESTNALYSIVDSITVDSSMTWWDLFIQYRALITIPLGSLIVILIMKKKRYQK